MVDFLKEVISSDTWKLYQPYFVSIILGGLVGIEREYKRQKEGAPGFGGVRTFILISLLGTLSAHISSYFGEPLLYIVVLSFVALLIVAQLPEKLPGLTSEISAILTFLIGVLCYKGEFQLASVLAIAVLSILSFKEQMHKFVKHLTLEDLFAFLKFAAVSVILYPLLPDTSLYGVNPKEVWTMVVIISTIDFIGYFLTKVAGERGILFTGLLGGLVSSTAVSATFSSLSKVNKTLIPEYAAGIVGASAIMFPRMVFITGLISVQFTKYLLVPFFTAFIFGIFFAYRISSLEKRERAKVDVKNPYELSNAIKFGAFYAFILFISRNTLKYLGDYGLYIIAAISGLSDVDAITLTVSKLFMANELSLLPAVISIVIAATVNTIFKWFLTLSMGTNELFKMVTPGFLALIVGEILGIGILVFWG
ncbi:MAG: MgtC/SapB family protein [Desulfurobacteriaceae bacterium]